MLCSAANIREPILSATMRRIRINSLGSAGDGRLAIRESVQDRRSLPILDTFIADLRFAGRMLKRNVALAAACVLTLAVGIGGTTAIFSLVHTVLLQPLPYRDPARLVWVSQYAPRLDATVVPAATFLAWRDQNGSFEDAAGYNDHLCDGNLSTGVEPVRLDRCAKVSANFFSLLGVQPVLGRSFSREDDVPGAPGVMILSDGFWHRRFGGNPEVLGKSVRLDDAEYTVIGILPPSFEYPSQLKPDAFVPLGLPTTADWRERESDDMSVVARLKQGISLQQAQANLRTITQSLTLQYPQAIAEKLAGADVQILPLHQRLVGDTRPALLFLMGAAGFVLLIACVNIANLLLARASARQKEFAMRAALGAAPSRIVRQLLTEGLLLAALGSAAGLLVARGTLGVVRMLRPDTIDYFGDVHLNPTALCFTLLISLMSAIFFSLAPAPISARTDVSIPLREAGETIAGSRLRQKLGSVLASAELALAFLLLMGAGLMLRTFANLRAVSPGFNPRNVLSVQVTLTEAKYPDLIQRKAFFDKLLAAVRATPGVESAGGTTDLPFYYGFSSPVAVTLKDHRSILADQSPSVPLSHVSPGYFFAMQVPLRAGRFFNNEDRQGASPVAIVSQEFARRFLMGPNLIGQHLTFAPAEHQPEQEFTIVGIVGDVRYIGLDRNPVPVLFTSTDQFPASALTLVVRTGVAPESLVGAIRREVHNLDPEQPIYHVATMEQRLSDSIGTQRFDTSLLGLFAVVAIFLATIGVYGVMSYWVTQSTREIGIRLALGAQPRDILRIVLTRFARVTLAGLSSGLIGTLVVAHFLRSLLFGVAPIDPSTLLAAGVILAGIALTAGWRPAHRAAGVDPMIAMRYE
jgi:putative ABC transport system permease protein